jgi:CrcB protein
MATTLRHLPDQAVIMVKARRHNLSFDNQVAGQQTSPDLPGAMSLPQPKSAGSASLASPSLGRLLADLLLVALGAIPGSLLRWLVDDLSVVNLLGAFVLGWLSATAAGRPRAWLLVGGVGFCGSLTSFSGWILALYSRIQASGWWVALACWLLELLSGLMFAALGLGLGQWMQRRWSAQLGDHLKH